MNAREKIVHTFCMFIPHVGLCLVTKTKKQWLILFLALFEQVLNPENICLFKVNNRDTRKKCEIYSKLKIKTL